MNKRIRELRNQLNMTQAAFGAVVGVTDGAVGNWEKGRFLPPESTVAALCEKLGVRPDWLKKGRGEMFVKKATLQKATAAKKAADKEKAAFVRDIPARVRDLRARLQMTQGDFASAIHTTIGTVARWESGKHSPGSPALNAISAAFGVRREWLRTGAGEMFVAKDDPKEEPPKDEQPAPEGVPVNFKTAMSLSTWRDFVHSAGVALLDAAADRTLTFSASVSLSERAAQ